MEIIKAGRKDLIGKILFKCNICQCEFIANEFEWKSYECTSPNIAYAFCPCCERSVEAYIDIGHADAVERIECEKKDHIKRLSEDE